MTVALGCTGATTSAGSLGPPGNAIATKPSETTMARQRVRHAAGSVRVRCGLRTRLMGHTKLAFASVRASEEDPVSARYLLLLVIVLYVIFVLFVPAMQSLLGYGFGTLVALVILWYVFFNNRGGRVL